MPEWWLEAALPSVVFGLLFVVWIIIPASDHETDIASKIRNRLKR